MAVATDWDALVTPDRQVVPSAFWDKLGPARRWLAQQVGRPWDAVYSDLKQRFDTRTTAGRHVVYDHLLPWVDDGRSKHRWSTVVVVDRHGILRPSARRETTYRRAPEPLPRPERDLVRWLAGRRVGARGPALFWFTATVAGAYRQHHRLDDEDAALWRSLPTWFRERHFPSVPAPSPTA